MNKKVSLYQGQVPAATTTLATAVQDGVIDAVTATNVTASSVNLQVWLSPSGAAASDANKVYDSVAVPPNSQISLGLLVNHAFPDGAILYAEAETATAVTLTVSGRV